MNLVARIVARDKNLSVLVLMTASTLTVLVALLGGRFLSAGNLQSMSSQVSEFGFLALAMGLAMLTGGIDLSIVSAAVLAGIMGATVMSGQLVPVTESNSNALMLAGILAALVTGMMCGLLNGVLVAKLSIPPILATLGTMILFTGIGMVITDGQSVPISIVSYSALGATTIANIPLIFVLMTVAFLVMGFALSRTRFGRRIYLFGENSVALRFSGVRNERVIILTYVTIGLLVGIAAVIMVSRVNSARVGFGESYLLQAILVVVLAGYNPYGGRGRVISLALGLILLQSLQSAFTILQFNPYVKNLIWGSLLLLVMVVNYYVARWNPLPVSPSLGPKEPGSASGSTGSSVAVTHRPLGKDADPDPRASVEAGGQPG
ncbi:ABC transporter permease [Arthrobacter sp. zg-Y859]|uniref:ABC transporter permease n=1 Tax=Arthrobacter jinronghuae TaxID=2964609 RepID=A0ABT1NRE4_9MICC|nr:ABC transporter permease [Arthrobacter jinronghuae]MCQ1950298.1 ABC transporter permease [Arthrobacter jinronghuae]UWX77278.1 ABC transporter permease [Arthrobacter jinronghuae]